VFCVCVCVKTTQYVIASVHCCYHDDGMVPHLFLLLLSTFVTLYSTLNDDAAAEKDDDTCE